MNISLLDPGLIGTKGHHFDLDLRLVRALEARGHHVEVHSGVNASPTLAAALEDAGMAAHATFRMAPYASLPADDTGAAMYRDRGLATIQDLKAVDPSSLWLWPTLFAYQFAAAMGAARAAAQAGAQTATAQFGGTWWLPRHYHPQGAATWARAAQRLARLPRPMVVGAYDEWLCDAYRGFTPELAVTRLPCPHDGAVNPGRHGGLRRIGFFGHQRPARGLDLMPALVQRLLERGYEVVVQDSGRATGARNGQAGLEVLPYIKDFAAEIARCDLVVWPSKWQSYVASCSGVVSECIASGVPVILPSGCLPAVLAARHGCGTLFHDYSAEAILQAVDEVAADFSQAIERARRGAISWHASNGTARLVDAIEAHAASLQ